MTHYFFDSSALIKRYVPETGTNWIRALLTSKAGNTIFIAFITAEGFTVDDPNLHP